MKRIFLLLIISGLVLTGCSLFPSPEETPLPQQTAEITRNAAQPESTAHPNIPTPTPGPVTLLIWLPPQFDPAIDTTAADILQARLDSFEQLNPGVSVELRVKAESGPGGLIESLTTTSAAAPLALPDLVALPYEGLQTAALKGLLYPFDDLTVSMSDPDWYDYAQELAHLQNSIFGLPFAGDTQLLVYRPERVEVPPLDWETALQTPGTMVFPAADPEALFTLTQYQANQGAVLDEEGRPFLDQNTLTEVLTFYQQAGDVGFFPVWLTQFQDDDQAWEAFLEDRTDMVVTWSSRHLKEMQASTDITPILTPDGDPYTLATGWVWALATSNPDHHELSVRLAEHLTAPEFLAEWTRSLSYLPPRPSALDTWPDYTTRSRFDLISRSAHLIPPADVLASLGPALERAAVDVLKQQSDPSSAAQQASESLAGP